MIKQKRHLLFCKAQDGEDMKLTTMALASGALAAAFALSGTLALAKTVHHKHQPSIRTYERAYDLYQDIPPARPGFFHPHYGGGNGDPDGPTSLSGTGSSQFGGGAP
jgi:hypothetical protein